MSAMNQVVERAQPATAPTLKQAKLNGSLRPLDKLRLRSQFGLIEQASANDIRRAAGLLLQRITDYYQVIQYTGPGYVYGRVDSTWPSALYAEAEHNYLTNQWDHREMGPCHPSCPISRVHDLAGWACLQTALLLAVDEMTAEVPEAKHAFDQARYLVDSMVSVQEISGVQWKDARRRLRTSGIRKVLTRLQQVLPNVSFGLGCIRPLVLAPSRVAAAGNISGIREWSLPVAGSAAA